MKAMLLHEQRPVERHPLVAGEIDRPEPAPDELLVRVNVCGICRTDLHEIEGELPMVKKSGPPVIPGHQVVGRVAGLGGDVTGFHEGDRVGIAWLHRTCGQCPFCQRDQENLCQNADFTGWTVNGGFAEYTTVPAAFAYRIPDAFPDEQAAPLLCAGIIGYRALRLSGIQRGQRLGLYGFGAAAHIAVQVAIHLGCEVYVFTRSETSRQLARKLGALWAGGADDPAPAKMNASVIYAPAGHLVRSALEGLEKGGCVTLAGIYMSPIPELDYEKHLYDEKVLRSVANTTRDDARAFLETAGQVPVRTTITTFPLDQVNDALVALKNGAFDGAGVLRITDD